jgi:hypothetical protein
MALGSTQPLTEMSTRNIPGGEGRPARKADNLTAICEPIVYKMWEPQHLTTLWVSTSRYMDTFTLSLSPWNFQKVEIERGNRELNHIYNKIKLFLYIFQLEVQSHGMLLTTSCFYMNISIQRPTTLERP